MVIRKLAAAVKVPIDMTPMIDIVFQLLVFFIMTLNIAAIEGDFNLAMPLAAAEPGGPPSGNLLQIRLTAAQDGELAEIVLVQNQLSFGRPAHLQDKAPWDRLQTYLQNTFADETLRQSAEVELDCDYNLHYSHVIAAITAVSGKRGKNGQMMRLVEKIKFSPPRAKSQIGTAN